MAKKTAVFLVLAGIIAIGGISVPCAAFAFEDTLVVESLRTIEGALTGIDADTKRVTVRWMYDSVMIRYEDITLNVPDTCVIMKESETSEISELETGDHVTVRYDQNAEPLPRAMSIVVS